MSGQEMSLRGISSEEEGPGEETRLVQTRYGVINVSPVIQTPTDQETDLQRDSSDGASSWICTHKGREVRSSLEHVHSSLLCTHYVCSIADTNALLARRT
jgi:hypothetical protein